MAEEHIVTHVYPPLDDRVRVKLTLNSKGYGWEISISGESGNEAFDQISDIDQRLREEYGGENGEKNTIKKPVGAGTPNGLDNATSL